MIRIRNSIRQTGLSTMKPRIDFIAVRNHVSMVVALSRILARLPVPDEAESKIPILYTSFPQVMQYSNELA